jgi:hypothetical protein
MDTTLHHWAAWISGTQLSLYLQKQSWIIVTSQSIHIACVSVVFASAVLISLRLLGIGSAGRAVSELVDTLVPWMYRALAVLVLTGVEQTIAAPNRQFMTTPFRLKMLLLAVATVFTVWFARAVRARAGRWDDAAARPGGARLFAVVWLGLWIGIIFCGRFIGYAVEISE